MKGTPSVVRRDFHRKLEGEVVICLKMCAKEGGVPSHLARVHLFPPSGGRQFPCKEGSVKNKKKEKKGAGAT